MPFLSPSYNMGIPKKISDRLKAIVDQVSGKIDEETVDLIEKYTIRGSGHIYCLLTDNRNFVKITRGIEVYLVDENYDNLNKALIYTCTGDIVFIDMEELILIGFD